MIKNISRTENNLDILRLIASWMILYSHSFILYGNKNDFSDTFLKNYSSSHIALSTFFIISGYLITASYLHKQDIKIFLISRIFRLIPALAVVLFLSVFLMGPIVTQLSIEEYFSDMNTYKYLRGVMLFPLRYELPGTFVNNEYPNVVNGSLWSLEVEFKCYLLIAALGFFKLLKKHIALILTSSCMLLYFIFDYFPELFDKRFLGMKYTNLHNGFLWFSAFLVGSCFYLYKEKILYSRKIFVGVIILDFLLWFLIPFGSYLRVITLAYFVLYIGFQMKSYGSKLNKNDISYGVYIYAFPIQQLYIMYVGESFGFAGFIITCTIITIIFGFLSWKLVERPALNHKRKLISKLEKHSKT